MMTCKRYIFLLTSGQLKEAPAGLRFEAATHRLICRYCRTFTRNDVRLEGVLEHYREALKQDEGGAGDQAGR